MNLERAVQQHGWPSRVGIQRSSLMHRLERRSFWFLFFISGDSGLTNRRSLNNTSTTYYQQQMSGPTQQTTESYRFYSQPSTNVTKVTEETRYYQLPAQQQQQQQQHSEITYSIQGTQQKFQPVSFLVTSDQQNTQQNRTTTTTTTDEEQSTSSFSLSRPTFSKVSVEASWTRNSHPFPFLSCSLWNRSTPWNVLPCKSLCTYQP